MIASDRWGVQDAAVRDRSIFLRELKERTTSLRHQRIFSGERVGVEIDEREKKLVYSTGHLAISHVQEEQQASSDMEALRS